MIDTKTITKLRAMTGAGLGDCKSALDESGGDVEKAVDILRKKGGLKAAKKTSTREAHEGVVDAYIHSNGKAGALVEIRSETDFVARNEKFKELTHDIAMQVVATNALYLTSEQVPDEEIEKEKSIYREQLKNEKKPEDMIEKIIQGKIEKYFDEVCLLRQPFIKDDSLTVQQLIDHNIATLGEKIEIVRFAHFSF
jgi:elongation factor Ts